MKLLITLLVITAAVYGVYNFTMAAYGWFQMSSIVDEVAKEELAKPSSSSFSAFDPRDRFGRIRERILKGAKEASVDLRPENVQLNRRQRRPRRTARLGRAYGRVRGQDLPADPDDHAAGLPGEAALVA